MNPRALGAALLFGLVLTPAIGHAEHALFGGLRIGGGVASRPAERTTLQFRVGATLDWVHGDGPTASLRIDTTDRIDATAALLFGWLGDGFFSSRGVPLGVAIGPIYGLDTRADQRAGGRVHAVWALWTNRATLDLDVDVRRRVSTGARLEPDGLEVIVGLSLRVVPWAPWNL